MYTFEQQTGAQMMYFALICGVYAKYLRPVSLESSVVAYIKSNTKYTIYTIHNTQYKIHN